jgi:hypothetical protein
MKATGRALSILLLLLAAACNDGQEGGGGGGDILARLRAIPGMTVTERADLLPPSLTGHRFFQLEYVQPVNHDAPGGPTFTQRLTLLHRDEAAPMVLYTSGYFVTPRPAATELFNLVRGNQLSVEHRYFVPSRPNPADWSQLTIAQAAADFHRIVQAFTGIYRGRWLNTGGSKGGLTAIFHRRFYPDDVYATVAYVAPISFGAPDARYISFLRQVGDADCRTRLKNFQVEALARRAGLKALLMSQAASLTFDHLGIDRAIEHAILETPFTLWQYSNASACADIPTATASDQAYYAFINRHASWSNFNDSDIDAFGPYYYQAAFELGYPDIDEEGLALSYPDTDVAPVYSPAGVPVAYDAGAMPDVANWVETQSQRFLFIYGENDPWSAGAFSLGTASDSFRYTVPAGNHGSRILQLGMSDLTQALETIARWSNTPVLTPVRVAQQALAAQPALPDPMDLELAMRPPL